VFSFQLFEPLFCFQKFYQGANKTLIEFSLKEHLCIFDIQEKQIEESKIMYVLLCSFFNFFNFFFYCTKEPNLMNPFIITQKREIK